MTQTTIAENPPAVVLKEQYLMRYKILDNIADVLKFLLVAWRFASFFPGAPIQSQDNGYKP